VALIEKLLLLLHSCGLQRQTFVSISATAVFSRIRSCFRISYQCSVVCLSSVIDVSSTDSDAT